MSASRLDPQGLNAILILCSELHWPHGTAEVSPQVRITHLPLVPSALCLSLIVR